METTINPEPGQPVGKRRFAERGIGICMIIGSGILGYLAVVLPLLAASQHEDDVSISMKGVVFVPALFIIGLVLLFTGDRESSFMGTKQKPSVIAWIILIAAAGIGIVLFEWLKSRMRAYGYAV